MKAFDHYKNFLAPIYSWSMGDKKTLFEKNKIWLQSNSIQGTLLDLGAGFGSHAIPAYDLGLDVTAVDFSPELLTELKSENANVRIVESDLVTFLRESGHYDNILCLGDTLTHLDDEKELLHLLNIKGRRIFLSWRDYKTLEFTLENSHIVVKDSMTCDLKVFDARKILVTDTFDGKAHSYHKLRISPEEVESFFPHRKIEKIIQGRFVQMVINP